MEISRVKVYYDVVSPYAWLALEVLRRYERYWGDRVETKYVPFFLGGIMKGAGNRPPISVPAKAKYQPKELNRAQKLMGLPKLRYPDVFPVQSYKDAADKGDVAKDIPWKVAERLWLALWTENKNTSDEGVMHNELDSILPGGWEKWKYAISDNTVKKRLTDSTQEALDDGCFGAPWFIITNKKGETESFFGSDRWDHICDFMGEKYLGYFPEQAAMAKL